MKTKTMTNKAGIARIESGIRNLDEILEGCRGLGYRDGRAAGCG